MNMTIFQDFEVVCCNGTLLVGVNQVTIRKWCSRDFEKSELARIKMKYDSHGFSTFLTVNTFAARKICTADSFRSL